MLTLKLVLSSGQIENSKQQKFQLICVTRYLVFTLAVVSPKGIESQRNNGSQVVSDHVHVLLPWTSVDGQPRLDGRTKRGDFGELSKNELLFEGESGKHIPACSWWRCGLPAWSNHKGNEINRKCWKFTWWTCWKRKRKTNLWQNWQVVDLMKRNPDVGAACGRIHPTGSGYMQWWAISKNYLNEEKNNVHHWIGQVSKVWVCHRTLAPEGDWAHAWLCSLQVDNHSWRLQLNPTWSSVLDASLYSEQRRWWTKMWCTRTPQLRASPSTLSSTTRWQTSRGSSRPTFLSLRARIGGCALFFWSRDGGSNILLPVTALLPVLRWLFWPKNFSACDLILMQKSL